MHLDRARRANTFDAHRLVHLAAEQGLAGPVKERLMRAYHSEGEAVGDPGTLARIAAESGLDADEVAGVLAGERFADAVRADEREAASLGIDAVPYFVVDRRFAARGAQAPGGVARALPSRRRGFGVLKPAPPAPRTAEGRGRAAAPLASPDVRSFDC